MIVMNKTDGELLPYLLTDGNAILCVYNWERNPSKHVVPHLRLLINLSVGQMELKYRRVVNTAARSRAPVTVQRYELSYAASVQTHTTKLL